MLVGHGARGPVRGIVGRVTQVDLGSTTLTDVVTVFAEDALWATPGADGNLGTEVLRRFRVTFDYRQERMVLERLERLSGPDPLGLSGITLGAEGAAWDVVVVTDVRSHRLGWQVFAPATPLTRFDGARPASLEEVERRLQRAGPVRLRIKRGTEHVEVALDLTDIV